VGYYSKVGCYAHATHVAGTIGASANGNAPRVGVYAGVNMVSIAVGTAPYAYNSAWLPCASGGAADRPDPATGVTVSSIGFAFDFIAAQNQPTIQIGGTANIATMSINGGKVGFTGGVAETNRNKLLTMVNPANVWRYRQGLWEQWYYPGIFFAQPAGNQNQNACSPRTDGASAAFQTTPSPNGTAVDGIMVVGVIRQNGTAASNGSGTAGGPGFTLPEPRIFSADPAETGSNFGSCIDIWAPGDAIYSTWGSGLSSTYSTATYYGGQSSTYVAGTAPGSPTNPNPTTLYQGLFGWQWLSGTSMAAPHVAAAAAYMADKYYLSTPTAIEQKIRDNWKTWGALDPTSTVLNPRPIRIVYLPD
jgi:Subtilase family